MKLIIDVPEKVYQNAREDMLFGSGLITNAIKNGTPIEQEPCEDCISRAELLKAIDTWDKFGFEHTGCFVREPKDDFITYVHYDDVIKCIKGLPSVQPEQEPNHGWHPSSDVPESRGMYLVTRHYGKGDEIEIAHYTDDMRVVDEYDYADTRRGGWYRYDEEYGNYEIDNVVAWMKLPEVYKEE